jgi:hypothetical protein
MANPTSTNKIMETIQNVLTPKNALGASLVVAGGLIALGLLATNPDSQNKPSLSPLGFDTSVVGPFSMAEIQAAWEQWRLDAQTSNNPSWAQDHVFNYCYNQFPVGGNVLQATDPTLSLFGYANIETFTTTYGSGWYVVVVTTNSTNSIQYATLFRMVTNISTNAATVPSNTSTLPHQYRLSYVNVIDNIVNGAALF